MKNNKVKFIFVALLFATQVEAFSSCSTSQSMKIIKNRRLHRILPPYLHQWKKQHMPFPELKEEE